MAGGDPGIGGLYYPDLHRPRSVSPWRIVTAQPKALIRLGTFTNKEGNWREGIQTLQLMLHIALRNTFFLARRANQSRARRLSCWSGSCTLIVTGNPSPAAAMLALRLSAANPQPVARRNCLPADG